MPGRRLGRYRLVERLGEGGMAVVYRARLDGPSGFVRDVVIKRVRPELNRDPQLARLLAKEARLCARLHHPAIVQVLDFGEHEGEHHLVLEYVDGIDLASLIRQARALGRPIPVGVACFLAREAAAALAYAHALGDERGQPLEIVHRDVSPSNLMVTAAGRLKLLDFGIARAAGQISDERTRTGVFKGKLGYLSPEQAEGLASDRRADLFALGVVLHECLTLAPLFRGADDLETLRLVREAEVRPPSSERGELDAEVDAAVMRLLARRPAERFADGNEVLDALAPIVHRLRGDAAAVRRFVDSLGPLPSSQAPLTAEELGRRRRLWAPAALGALAAAAAIAGVIRWQTRPALAVPPIQPTPIAPAPIPPTLVAPTPVAIPHAAVAAAPARDPIHAAKPRKRHAAPSRTTPAKAHPERQDPIVPTIDPKEVKDPFAR